MTFRTKTLSLVAASAALFAHAAVVDQTVTLNPGWNAVYVGVGPDGSADEVFASWPVESVSAYNADNFRVTADTSGGLTGESTVLAPFLVWSREGHASTLRRLSADTVLLCCNTNSSAFTTTLRGVPAAPRIAWHTSSADETYNYVGVRLADPSASVSAARYFAGCPALAANPSFYRVATSSSGEMSVVAYGGGFPRVGSLSASLTDGAVLLVPGVAISDWSGPLYVSPRAGVDFGETDTRGELTIRNDGSTNKIVQIEYVASSDGIPKPDVMFSQNATIESIPTWNPFTNSVSRYLSAGETWTVSLALDRTKLAGTGGSVGGIVRVSECEPSDQGYTGFMAQVPISALDVKPSVAWPQGLWLVQGRLTAVNWQASDERSVEGVAAGGAMPVKFYVHVDSAGKCRLLQRAVISGLANGDGTITEDLYGPDAELPAGRDYTRRLSSAVLPVDMGAVESSSGAFGDCSAPLLFSYSIGPNSPSNPFFHALHPLFDNKKMDFETPAPSGDDISNYIGTVKPERFTIGGEVRLSFADNAGTAWSPEESLMGTCTWIYTGLRREGPVTASGAFTARRILKSAAIEL